MQALASPAHCLPCGLHHSSSAPAVRRATFAAPQQRGTGRSSRLSKNAVLEEASAAVASTSATLTASGMTFEPRADPAIVGAQVAVLGITAGAALYWWYVVVPTARGRLAIDKRKGETAEYLSELETEGAVEERRAERWLYAEWLQKRADLAAKKAALPAESVSIATASGEAAIASSTSSSKPNMSPRKVNTNLLEPEIRTPMPNFFSFDNPIVATLGALAGISICTSIISMLFTE